MQLKIRLFSSIRRYFLLTLVLAAIAATGLAQASRTGLAEQAAQVKEFDVNGLKVLVKTRASAPTVAAGLFIRGGARNITKENAGIESFMLDVAAEAGKKYSRETVRRELARTGSSIDSGSNNDFSVFSLASTRDQFDHTWDIFTDLILNPSFAADDLERIREGYLTGLREQESDADNYLKILQERVVYAGHPYANSVGGTIQTIRRLSAEDLRTYHKSVMQTSQLLLIVVGDIEASDLKNRVEATFGKLPRGNYKDTAYPPLDFSKGTLDVSQRSLPTNYVQGVFEAPPLGSKDYSAMRVAMTLLQGRVFQEVRVKRQLSYAPNAEMNILSANTAFIYVTAVEPNEAVQVMLQEIRNIKENPVDQETIDSIGGHFLTLYYLDQQTNGEQAAELARYELIGGGWAKSFEFLNEVREVKPADIQRVAGKYMKNIRFVVVGDPRSVDRSVFLGN